MLDADFTPRAKARKLPNDWGAADDNRLRDTKGRYGRIARLSDQTGIAERALLTRWHLLRAGGVAPRDTAVASFNDLLAEVTPAMRRICKVLYQDGPMSRVELAEALDKTKAGVSSTIRDNTHRLALCGWEITPGTPVGLRRTEGGGR